MTLGRKKQSKLEKERRNKFDRPNPHWLNLEVMKADEKVNELLKTVMN